MVDWLRGLSWRSLRVSSALQERLRRRFTPVGQGLLGGTLMAGLFGLDTRQTLAFQAFSLGAALLLLAWLATLARPRPLVASRSLPRHATVGLPCRYRLELVNPGRRALPPLELAEILPDPRPDRARFLRSPAPGERASNPLDRLFGYPRWRWLVDQGQWLTPPPPLFLPRLAPGARQGLELEILPRRRGVLALAGLRLYRVDPLGLARRARLIPLPGRLIVLPRRYPVPPQRPPGRRRLQPGGLNLAASPGESPEFRGLRDYRPGDSPRHIHWPAWARTGQPVVKEYQDEFFSRQALILDSFPAPGQEAAFEAAVSVAASFVEPLQGADSLLDLMFVADQAHTLTGGRGLLASTALLEALAALGPSPPAEFPRLARAVLAHAPQLSACLCVLLAWDAPRQELARSLRGLGLGVRVFVVGAAEALQPGPLADAPDLLRRLDPADLAAGLAQS